MPYMREMEYFLHTRENQNTFETVLARFVSRLNMS